MLRRPAAALLRCLAPRLSGGAVGAGSSTRRTLPPHIAPSFLARFSSTPTSSPPPSSVGARDDEAEDDEIQGESGSAGARLSISVDRSGLYSPPGRNPLILSQTYTFAQICARTFLCRVSYGAGLVYAAEHLHEPSSDSELVKHLKSIIKVLMFSFSIISL